MTTATDTVTRSVQVRVPVDAAWRIFTEQMHRWWPLATHSLAAEDDLTPDGVVIEGRVGGRIYETIGDDRRSWGTIATWEPPTELAVDWEVHPGMVTRWTATFTAVGTGTRLDLVHTGFAAYGSEGACAYDSYGSNDGWSAVLAAYVAFASA